MVTAPVVRTLEITPPLKKLLGFYRRERDREGLDLFDLRDQYETGQEFTSRYFHADEQADRYGWEHKLRLKGVDVTTYVYHLVLLLRDLAAKAGDAERFREYEADGISVKLERETLHVMDDEHRVALVETKTADTSLTTPAFQVTSRQRYQVSKFLHRTCERFNIT